MIKKGADDSFNNHKMFILVKGKVAVLKKIKNRKKLIKWIQSNLFYYLILIKNLYKFKYIYV